MPLSFEQRNYLDLSKLRVIDIATVDAATIFGWPPTSTSQPEAVLMRNRTGAALTLDSAGVAGVNMTPQERTFQVDVARADDEAVLLIFDEATQLWQGF